MQSVLDKDFRQTCRGVIWHKLPQGIASGDEVRPLLQKLPHPFFMVSISRFCCFGIITSKLLNTVEATDLRKNRHEILRYSIDCPHCLRDFDVARFVKFRNRHGECFQGLTPKLIQAFFTTIVFNLAYLNPWLQ